MKKTVKWGARMSSIYDGYFATGHVEVITPSVLESIFTWYEDEYGKVLDPNEDSRIVDLGCGPGYFLGWLQRKGYKNVIGVDDSDALLTMAKRLGVPVVQDDLLHFLKESNETFDVISLFHVLEHFTVDSGTELLRLIRNHLSPGGVFLVAVPNAMSPYPQSAYGDISHRMYFSWQSLRQLLILSGFSDVTYLRSKGMRGTQSIFGRIRRMARAGYIRKLIFWERIFNGFADAENRPMDSQLIAICGTGEER